MVSDSSKGKKRKQPDSGESPGGSDSKRRRNQHGVEDGILILPRPDVGIHTFKSFKATKDKLAEGIDNALEGFMNTKDQEHAKTTIFKVVHDFVTDPEVGQALQEGLNQSFSAAEFAKIAPFFESLNPHAIAEEDAGFTKFDIKRFHLPESIFEDILRDLDGKFNEFGFPHEHASESTRNNCISAIFTRLLVNFPGIFINRPEVVTPSDLSKRKGRMEHRWTAFKAICAHFCEVKLDVHNGIKKLSLLAQMMMEADGCAQLNHEAGHCVPIIGITSSGTLIQSLVYHPHCRRFYLSKAVYGLSVVEDTLGLIKSIRRISETFMTLILSSYINTLDAFLQQSEIQAVQEKKRRGSTEMWKDALRLAKEALEAGQDASEAIANKDIGESTRMRKAEVGAQAAMDLLKESISKAPESQKKERPSLLGEYQSNREMWSVASVSQG